MSGLLRTPEQYLASAAAAGGYLQRVQGLSGAFEYQVDPFRPNRKPEHYNILRHAGTAWSLFLLARATGYEIHARTGSLAVNYLLSQVHTGASGRSYVLDETSAKAKLGALGLGLLALTERLIWRENSDDRVVARGLVAQIAALQCADGRFESFIPLDNHPTSDWSSLYYPGEAMLGLLRYAEIAQDSDEANEIWGVVYHGIDYLIGAQQIALDTGVTRTLPPDAWFLQAIEAAMRGTTDETVRERYLYHAVALADALLAPFVWEGAPVLEGAYGPFPTNSCRTAARGEGVLAAYRLAQGWGVPVGRGVYLGALNLSDTYLQQHVYAGRARVDGGLVWSGANPSIRIDTVQHAISFWVGMAGLSVE